MEMPPPRLEKRRRRTMGKTVNIYTFGAWEKNTETGGWAAIVPSLREEPQGLQPRRYDLRENQKLLTLRSGGYCTSGKLLEIKAAVEALEKVKEQSRAKKTPVIIHCGSAETAQELQETMNEIRQDPERAWETLEQQTGEILEQETTRRRKWNVRTDLWKSLMDCAGDRKITWQPAEGEAKRWMEECRRMAEEEAQDRAMEAHMHWMNPPRILEQTPQEKLMGLMFNAALNAEDFGDFQRRMARLQERMEIRAGQAWDSYVES